MEEPIDFWSYSLDVYSRSGVASACLALQNDLDVDVNVLLYCCWHGTTRGAISDRNFDAVRIFTTKWSSALVGPLRSARSWLKIEGCDQKEIPREDCETLRQRIKEAELECERLQQIAMEHLSPPPDKRLQPVSKQANASLQNIATYLEALGANVSGESCAHLVAILSGIFPGIDSSELEDRIRGRFT